MSKKGWNNVVTKNMWAALLLCLYNIVLWYILSLPGFENIGASSGDLLPFWIAGKVALQGGNPYDLTSLVAEIRQIIPSINTLLPVYNPPWAFTILIPLSLIPFSLLPKIWFILSFNIILISFLLSWQYFSKSVKELPIFPSKLAVITVAIFFPIYQTLALGQLVPIILLCLVTTLGILSSESKSTLSDIIAGILLVVTTIKPHLLTLTYLYLILILLNSKNYRFLSAFMLTFILSCIIPSILNSNIYHFFLQSNPIPMQWKNPTIGVWLLLIFGQEHIWLRFLPLVVGVLSLILWFVLTKQKYLSKNILYITLPVSLMISPYLWTYDFILLLPFMVFLLAENTIAENNHKKSYCSFIIPGGLIICNILLWIMPPEMHFAVWYPIALAGLGIRIKCS